jgi:hypothetical protein
MAAYRKKPVVIEACQFTGDNITALQAWAEACPTCGVGDGQPCVGMSNQDSVLYPRHLKRPHRTRKAK